MAGKTSKGVFREKISPFLRRKMEELKSTLGEDSPEYRALHLQYVISDIEKAAAPEANLRHWEADMAVETQEHALRGLERLYANSMVIEPTMICAAHCRYCLRANYDIFTLSDGELREIARFCGGEGGEGGVTEVLVTGGDPLVVPRRLNTLLESLVEHAPNIRTVRIGSRLPVQDPERVDTNVYELLRKFAGLIRIEIGTQINHEVELFPESREVFENFRARGVKVYSQNVLLKGVNDDTDALVRLYRTLRLLDIEPHYLFHSVPMMGMHHLRTTVARGLQLARELCNSGEVSGRGKPMFALMTDIGKITLYEGTVQGRNEENNHVLVKSCYKYADRMKFNPDWQLPRTAQVEDDGYLSVWYLDGVDD